eukprot:TRINITY_DN37732_c0_g1_i1.p1 TRINITY_DN37732_c0_g1~~TRINITY_DN37732_c0_g1_i1.p1  ORF type:complete len:321 (+),score=55.64 TRINITY_DN37732_c0_g1_i1:2-964(+)
MNFTTSSVNFAKTQYEKLQEVPWKSKTWIIETFLTPPDPFKDYELPDPNPIPVPQRVQVDETTTSTISEDYDGSFSPWEAPDGFRDQYLGVSHKMMQEGGGTSALLREVEDALDTSVSKRGIVMQSPFTPRQRAGAPQLFTPEPLLGPKTYVNMGIQTPKRLLADVQTIAPKGVPVANEALYCSPRPKRSRAPKEAAKPADSHLLRWLSHQIWPFSDQPEDTPNRPPSPADSVATSNISLATKEDENKAYSPFATQPKRSTYSFIPQSPVVPPEVAKQLKRRRARERFNTLTPISSGAYTTPGALTGRVVDVIENKKIED